MTCYKLIVALLVLSIGCATNAQIRPSGPDPRAKGERTFDPVWGVIVIRIDSITMVPTLKMDKRIDLLRSRIADEFDPVKATRLDAQLKQLEKTAIRQGEWFVEGPATAKEGARVWSLGFTTIRISRSHGAVRKAAKGDYLGVLNPQYVKGGDWHSAEYRVGVIDAPDLPKWWIGASRAQARRSVPSVPSVPSAPTVRHPILGPSGPTQYAYHAPPPDATEMTVAEVVAGAIPAVFTVFGHGSLASGFVINAKGIALTNRHVVENDRELQVRFANGRVARAVILGVLNHPEADLALLDLEGDGYPFIPLGSSNDLQLGQEVILIGAPEGLEHSVSKGIVSSFRDFDGVRVIQTDAASNPGSSGGPMISRMGLAVGVHFASWRKDTEGLKLSIAIDEAIARFPLLAAGRNTSPAKP